VSEQQVGGERERQEQVPTGASVGNIDIEIDLSASLKRLSLGSLRTLLQLYCVRNSLVCRFEMSASPKTVSSASSFHAPPFAADVLVQGKVLGRSVGNSQHASQLSHRRWCDYSSKPPRITTGLWRTLSQNSRPSRRGWISAALRPPSSCATTAKSLGRGWPSLSGGMSVDERTHVCAVVCTRTHYMHTLPLETLPLSQYVWSYSHMQ